MDNPYLHTRLQMPMRDAGASRVLGGVLGRLTAVNLLGQRVAAAPRLLTRSRVRACGCAPFDPLGAVGGSVSRHN